MPTKPEAVLGSTLKTEEAVEPVVATVETLLDRPEVEAALSIVAIRTGLRANYSGLMRETVFPAPSSGLDRKTMIHHQRLLEGQNARALLEIIWKESLPDEELTKIGAARLFPVGELNAHQLAVRLSGDDPGQVARTNSTIRNVSIAASDYLLIDRKAARSTLVRLVPTERLHSFMITLAVRDLVTIQSKSCALRRLHEAVRCPLVQTLPTKQQTEK